MPFFFAMPNVPCSLNFARSLLCVALLTVTGAALPVRADEVTLSADWGVGGRYRPGKWAPVTVRLVGSGPAPLTGQVQILATPPGSGSGGFPRAAGAEAVWARPVRLTASAPQTVSLCVRGLAPERDDVSVRFVDDAGRIRGQLSIPASTPTPALSGSAVEPRDLLLVGWADDPAAFSFLGGQRWDLQHTPADPLPVSGPSRPASPSVQIAVAATDALPDRAAALGGVDAVLLRADAPLDALTESQSDALRGWVAQGGHMIVCLQSDPSRLDAPFFTNLLPARVGPPKAQRRAGTPNPLLASALTTLIPESRPGVRVLGRSPEGLPFAVAGPYGAGLVVLTAFDPTTPAFRGWTGPGEAAFWRSLILGGEQPSPSLLGVAASREEFGGYSSYGGRRPQLTQAVGRTLRPAATPARAVGLYLLLYVLVLALINYVILKRLHRQEWVWLTIPGLVALFAAGTYGLGALRRPGGSAVTRLALVETSAGSRLGGVYSSVGLFSTHRATEALSLPDPNALAAPPSSGTFSPEQPRVVQVIDGIQFQNVAVTLWGMRAWDVQTTTDLGGAVDAALSGDRSSGTLAGIVWNRTRYDLTDCAVLYQDRWQPLGRLPHGSNAVVRSEPSGLIVLDRFNRFLVPTGGGVMRQTFGREDTPDSLPRDTHARLRDVLAEYARSLGDERYRGYSASAAAFTPRPDEAILIGWSDDPALAGPAPLLNGRAPGPLNAANLVIVHVPVRER